MVKTDFPDFRILAFQNNHGKPSKNYKKNVKQRLKNGPKNHEKTKICEPLEIKDPWNHAHSKELAESFRVVDGFLCTTKSDPSFFI